MFYCVYFLNGRRLCLFAADASLIKVNLCLKETHLGFLIFQDLIQLMQLNEIAHKCIGHVVCHDLHHCSHSQNATFILTKIPQGLLFRLSACLQKCFTKISDQKTLTTLM